jgi:hypothetical protein
MVVVLLGAGAAGLSVATSSGTHGSATQTTGLRVVSTIPANTLPSAPVSPPTTAFAAPPPAPRPTPTTSSAWRQQVISVVGSAQDVAPTPQALYWLETPGANVQTSPLLVIPVRYDEATHAITKGPSMSGDIGDPALTVTGGWVWVVVGIGGAVAVEQFDPLTMARRVQETLTVPQSLNSLVTPILAATVNGPLWVAAGDDLWALNPSTGAVEKEFDAVTGNPVTVANVLGITSPSVAATGTGVWVAVRTGMLGTVSELSSSGLNTIAPPSSSQYTNTYDGAMGFSLAVSDGVLWLGNGQNGFQCADPATGDIRATEALPSAFLEDAYALNGVVYAFDGNDLVAITPPAACFG